ncbi:hypothetical protein JKG68_07290 [Microvirga aerilata]|uniref:Uncharacterized protein n=1 Tax=Microvirga aerilata TaxID=670292 RepID=A0A936Z7N7_9HYPH|nr:hypothetical protein [Microvirga aerilata]MBL0403762.1 hypothetical protein [Microvirga aerilata]
MKSGSVFGLSVRFSGNDQPYQNLLLLDYDPQTRAWLQMAMYKARKAVEDLQEEPSLPLNNVKAKLILEVLLSQYCIDALKNGDAYTASGYAHALMKYHETLYGILVFDEESGPHFERVEAASQDEAVAMIMRRLPNLGRGISWQH